MEALKDRYWLVRIVFLRCLAMMYAVAFLVAFNQNESLIGEHGLTPAVNYLGQKPADSTVTQLILSHPTIFWVIPPTTANLNYCAGAGLGLSMLVTVLGSANVPLMFLLWALYFSIVTVGQRWYSFGWESQLLETGFLAMFMVPVLSLRKFPKLTPTPWVAVWGYRWLLFRIMIGAGMIKIRGDQCWRDLTCMNYHYQTQPVPNPFSIYFHNTPEFFHKIETMGNHVVELVLPALLLFPHRYARCLGGLAQIAFQGVLIMSGNLAFLNWLTALPAVMCFDDAFVAFLFDKHEVRRAVQAEENYKKTVSGMGVSWAGASISVRRVVTLAMAVWIAHLSYPVVNNILSPSQAMNISFDPFRIVNSYGAFGSITKVRHEVILQGTDEHALHPGTVWRDFEFTCKPGDINRRPCWISPYHLRIDWLMWFAAFQNYQQCPWLVHLTDKLLSGDPVTAQLLGPNGNPFNATLAVDPGQQGQIAATTPTFVRAELYEYEYPSLDAEQSQRDAEAGWEMGKWWKRRWVRSYLPAVERDNASVKKFLQAHRMLVED